MNGEVVSAFRRSLGWVSVFLLVCALTPRPGFADGCSPTADHLCLNGSRFQVEVSWVIPGIRSGTGQAVPMTADTGAFWFFSGSNLELVVKVLDGRPINRHFWVFYGGLSDMEYTLTVTDTQTGVQEVYHNPAGNLVSASDVNAFDPEAPGAAAAAKDLPLVTELRVNDTTLGMQWQPAVAMAPGGGFLVAWVGEEGIYGRLYDATGAPSTGEMLLSGANSLGPSEPHVAASPSGGFLVVWSESGRTHAKARFVAADGQLPAGVLPLGLGYRSQALPDLAADATGFLALWLDGTNQSDEGVLHAQRLDPQGNPSGEETDLGVSIDRPIRIAASPLGGFLVTWSSVSFQAPFVSRVMAWRLDAAGLAAGTPFEVTPAGGVPGNAVRVLPVFYADGGFSLIWNLSAPEVASLFARRYLPDGQPAGDSVRIWTGGLPYPQPPLAALPLSTGGTWVLWSAWGVADDPDGQVLLGDFDPSWTLRGALSRMNAFTRAEQSWPALAGGPAGGVAVWQSGVYPIPIDPIPPSYPAQGQDGSYMGIFGQRFILPTCALEASQLCLDGRFRVEVQFTDPRNGQAGTGQGIPLNTDTGAFWFFDPSNVELIVKVLDGRPVNGHFWVYTGALSDVAYTITVTDTVTGKSKVYVNAAHQLASRSDTVAF